MNIKNIKNWLCASTFIIMAFGCTSPAQKQLIEKAESLNSAAPVEISDLGNIEKVVYDKNKNSTEITFSVSPDLENYILAENNQTILQNEFRLICQNEIGSSIMGDIVHAKSDLNLIFVSESELPSSTLSLTNAQLIAYEEDYMSDAQLNLLILDNEVAKLDSECPVPSQFEGVMINRIVKDGNTIDFYYEINENVISFASLEKKKDEIREQFRRTFRDNRNDPAQIDLFKRVLDANVSFTFIFYSDKSEEKKFEIIFTPQELYALGLK